jgi:DNA (cytosine-5)-methyltransferase 1
VIYGSVCSGIEAVSVAWRPLGWTPRFFAEIEPAASAVLTHHYREVPNLGDFTKIPADAGPVDVLVGGTPCQSFSVAGFRAGLADDRGNLALEFLRLARRLAPRWIVWENVPGVLSSNRGRDLGAFLGALGELGYGWAYRVLDAEYVRVDGFGRAVPQRRRRVFVVGRAGDASRAAAVLFDAASLSGDPPPRRTTGSIVAGTLDARAAGGGFPGSDGACGGHVVAVPEVARSLTNHHGRSDGDTEDFVPVGYIVNAAESCAKQSHARAAEVARCLDSTGGFASSQGGTVALAYQCHGNNVGPMGTLRKGDGGVTSGVPFVTSGLAVRRLLPVECERLMGLPDEYTRIRYRGKVMADAPRYKLIGNSMAVNVVRWLGRRIEMVESSPFPR